jgi:hypothetical protein
LEEKTSLGEEYLTPTPKLRVGEVELMYSQGRLITFTVLVKIDLMEHIEFYFRGIQC